MCLSDGLQSVNLGAFGGSIAPKGLSLLVHLCYTILVSYHDVAIAQEDCIADFAALQPIVVAPLYLTVFDDEHASLLALTGVEEVMSLEAVIDILCRNAVHRQCQSYNS